MRVGSPICDGKVEFIDQRAGGRIKSENQTMSDK
jgi:hypothetical protein